MKPSFPLNKVDLENDKYPTEAAQPAMSYSFRSVYAGPRTTSTQPPKPQTPQLKPLWMFSVQASTRRVTSA